MNKLPKVKQFVKKHKTVIITASATTGILVTGALAIVSRNAYFEVPKPKLKEMMENGGGFLYEHADRQFVLGILPKD